MGAGSTPSSCEHGKDQTPGDCGPESLGFLLAAGCRLPSFPCHVALSRNMATHSMAAGFSKASAKPAREKSPHKVGVTVFCTLITEVSSYHPCIKKSKVIFPFLIPKLERLLTGLWGSPLPDFPPFSLMPAEPWCRRRSGNPGQGKRDQLVQGKCVWCGTSGVKKLKVSVPPAPSSFLNSTDSEAGAGGGQCHRGSGLGSSLCSAGGEPLPAHGGCCLS